MQPEPVTGRPPRRVRPALLRQGLRAVTFLHWPLDPAVAAPLLPAGTRPDLHDGRTYVGVVGLEMTGVRVAGGPPVPWLGTFGEVNVRLYSVDDAGRRGVVFLEMHADRLAPVVAARALTGLPYAWHRVRVAQAEGRCSYTVGTRPDTAHIEVRPGDPREPDQRELFLVARWGLHTRVAGRTVYLGIEHDPWPLQDAELLRYDGDLLMAAGVPGISGPPESVLWSPGVDARLGPVVE